MSQSFINWLYLRAVGPFFITCNRERIFLSISKDSEEVQATKNIKDASKFFIVRCNEGDNHFNIVYEAPSLLIGKKKEEFDKKVGKHKPPVPMYLCVPVNWHGRTRSNQPVRMQMNGKASQSRMALHSRRSKQFHPAKLTEWINEKEIFYVNCKERGRGRLKKSSYLCWMKHHATLQLFYGTFQWWCCPFLPPVLICPRHFSFCSSLCTYTANQGTRVEMRL